MAQSCVAQDPVAATAAAAPALQSQAGSSQPAGVSGMRRSVGMRDSMCFFLQLEGAVEGQNGFEPEEVLKVLSLPVDPITCIRDTMSHSPAQSPAFSFHCLCVLCCSAVCVQSLVCHSLDHV